MPRKKLPPITPGEVLLEEFLKPLEVSQYQLAKDVGVPPRRINEIVLGKRAVTAGRHCPTASPVLRHLRPVLAESPGST